MQSGLEALADELGILEAELAPLRNKINRADMIRRAIRQAFKDKPGNTAHRVTGMAYEVHVGECGNVSVVDRAALMERVGVTKFAEVAEVSLKTIEENFGLFALAAVVSKEQTGPRPLEVVRLPVAAAAALVPPKSKAKAVAKTKKAA